MHPYSDDVSQGRSKEPTRGTEGLDSEEGDTVLPAKGTQSSKGLRWNTQKAKIGTKTRPSMSSGNSTEWMYTSVAGVLEEEIPRP